MAKRGKMFEQSRNVLHEAICLVLNHKGDNAAALILKTNKIEKVPEATESIISSLVNLDGKKRLDALRVTKKHYGKKTLAKTWRNDIAKLIHPDVCAHPLANQAMNQLNNLYESMIK